MSGRGDSCASNERHALTPGFAVHCGDGQGGLTWDPCCRMGDAELNRTPGGDDMIGAPPATRTHYGSCVERQEGPCLA